MEFARSPISLDERSARTLHSCFARRRSDESRACRQYRRSSGADRLDDLAVVDALQVHGRDAEVGVAQLALDDVQRHSFSGHLDAAWACRSWCGAKRRRTPARTARVRSVERAAAGDHGGPAVGPSITHSSAPTGSVSRASNQGPTCDHAQRSIPTWRRLPPLPQRTTMLPRDRSKSLSARATASLMRSPARQRTHHESSGPQAVRRRARDPHDGHNLLYSGRISRIAQPLFRGGRPQ